jgi:hypothetical protein
MKIKKTFYFPRFWKKSPFRTHSFDDEVIRPEAYFIWQEHPENSDKENWDAAIESLKHKQYQFLNRDGDKRIEELYLLYRDYIKHENVLINYRTTWLITIQAFLITTFGFSYQKRFEVISSIIRDENNKIIDIQGNLPILQDTLHQYGLFIIFLSVIGIATSFFAFLSINAAIRSIKAVRDKWHHISGYISSINYTIIGHLPTITGGGDKFAYQNGKKISQFLPIFFILFWFMVALFIRFRWI